MDSFASSFIGLAQLHENEDGTKRLIGTSGLESSLNSILAGTDGIITYEKDRLGNIVPGTDQASQQTVDGKDVYTTLSSPLQSFYGNTDGCLSGKGKRQVYDGYLG